MASQTEGAVPAPPPTNAPAAPQAPAVETKPSAVSTKKFFFTGRTTMFVAAFSVALSAIVTGVLLYANPDSGIAATLQQTLGMQGGSGGEKGGEADKDPRFTEWSTAFEGLRALGMSGPLAVKDFGNGIGLAPSVSVEKNAILLTIPAQALAVTAHAPRAHAYSEQLETAIKNGAVSPTAAFLVNFAHVRKQSIGKKGGVGGMVGSMPGLKWQEEHGLFKVPAWEFALTSHGTSMERWQTEANAEVESALKFASEHNLGLSLEEMRWAFLLLNSHGQRWNFDATGAKPVFLLPLFFGRPTPEAEDAIRMVYDQDSDSYILFANKNIRVDEEVYVHMPEIGDAMLIAYRGLVYSSKHRMRVELNLDLQDIPEASKPLLQQWGCAGVQPFYLRSTGGGSGAAASKKLFSCMRMLAAAGNATKLHALMSKSKWSNDWPVTNSISRKNEMHACNLGEKLLKDKLDKIMSVNVELREKLGNEEIAQHVTVKVREAEARMLSDVLKLLTDVRSIAESEMLWDTYQEIERERTARALAKAAAETTA